MARSKKNRSYETNRNARIVSRINGKKLVTKTMYRDPGTLIVETKSDRKGAGATRLFIRDGERSFLALNGNEARTLYETLQEHFAGSGRSF